MHPSNVVITGLGVVSAIGIGGDEYFRALMESRTGIGSLATNDDSQPDFVGVLSHSGLRIGGAITDFDPKPYVRPRKALKVMCREIQTAFVASQLAIIHADLDSVLPCAETGIVKPDRAGTVFGSEMLYGSPTDMVESFTNSVDQRGEFDPARFGTAAMRGIMPLWMLKHLPNMPACHIGIAINAQGPNNSLVLGDVSGPAALIESCSSITRGLADIMITGSTGTRINTTRLLYRNDLPIAEAGDPISLSSRPHDPASRGVVGGEGAAAIVLESAEHATNRGIQPIAVIAGTASRFVASDAISDSVRSNAANPKSSRGSADAIALAIDGAIAQAQQTFGYTTADVGAVVSHGMGDPCTDHAEKTAIDRMLPDAAIVAPISSIGHTGAASGSIAIATAALLLANDTILPTVNSDRAVNIHLLSQPQPLSKRCVIALAHTSDGSATAIVLAKP